MKRVKARVIPCPHQPLAMGDNTVSVVSGGTATPGATEQLFQPDRLLKELYIYIYIYIYKRSINSRDYIGCLSSFLVCSLWFKKKKLPPPKRKRVYFWPLMSLSVYGKRFMVLLNHTGMVVPRAFHSWWKLIAFDQIQLDAYCSVVWRRFEATFKLQPMKVNVQCNLSF